MSYKLMLKDVAYFSSEHPKNSVKNLLSGVGNWTTPANSKLDVLEAEFCLPHLCQITGIDVGNYWSASLEILVGLSEWPQSRREVLLPEHIFMNRIDCSVGENKQKMMFFREQKFNKEVMVKKWDRVKVVCKQTFKFNNDVFGLGMFVIHGAKDVDQETESAHEVGKSAMGTTKTLAASKPGLAEFMKKAGTLSSSTPKASRVTSVLKNLENQKRVVETDSGVSFSSSFNASAMSRTAKLVVQGQKQTGKQPSGFEKEAAQFLRDCQFEKKTFAEIEGVTFRNVKELWLEKKKYELRKEEKDVLKTLSSQYISKLVNKSYKRSREDASENIPPKKRKISDQVQNMRKNVDLIEIIDDDNSSMRNRIATMDMEKPKEEEEEDDPDILELRKKFKQTKQASSSKILKTPNPPSLTKKLATVKAKTPKSVEGWHGKTKTLDKREIPNFDLNFSPEMSPKCSPKVHKASPSNAKFKPNPIPNYNRKHLLSVPHKELISSGVLVQVYNYKKEKKLPLKGKIELTVKKGEPVTFFKVGRDIHLEFNGRFYLPDIQEEHMERVFKNFSPKEVSKRTYPENLDKLLKLGAGDIADTVQSSSKPEKEKKVAKSDMFNSPPPLKKEKAMTAIPTSPAKEEGECPICAISLPIMKLADHAADCMGLLSDTEVEEGAGSGGGGSKGLVACPICQLEVESGILEQHANSCAASMFGV